MRSSDRTYSQKLGFDDPDRHNEIHNAAAIYLASKDKVYKLINMLRKGAYSNGPTEWEVIKDDSSYDGTSDFSLGYEYKVKPIVESRESKSRVIKSYGYTLNSPIKQQSSSGYINIIGYVDVVLGINAREIYKYERRVCNLQEVKSSKVWCRGIEKFPMTQEEIDKCWDSELSDFEKKKNIKIRTRDEDCGFNIYVEVKHGFVDVSSVVQQINTYQAFLRNSIFVLCTLYPINAVYKQVLKDHNIHHIYVSPESVEEFMSAKSEKGESF